MIFHNISVITMFTLSGLSGTLNYRLFLFSITLLCYCVIMLVNGGVILAIIVDRSLHQPMYIILCNLCINELYGTAGFYPKFLVDLLSPSHVISYAGCFLQGYVIYSFACSDFSILALMAYDRYVAICRPLVYHSVMSKYRLSGFMFLTWLLPFSLMLMSTLGNLRSSLCTSHIPKIYCTNWFIGKLACNPPITNTIIPFVVICFYLCHVVFIVWSYMYLIRTCLKSKENQKKFMQTCVPHLISLFNLVISLLFDLMYMRFGSEILSQDVQNFIAIEFLLVPPILNPLIYGFKLTKIRNRIMGFVCNKKIMSRQA